MTEAKVPTHSVFGINGHDIASVAILMYPEPIVRTWQSLMAGARAVLGAPSGGLVGFIGSPEWALGGAALMGTLRTASANAAAKKALGMLTEADKLRSKMIDSAVLIPIASISNIDLPDPGAWVGKLDVSSEVSIKKIGPLSRGSFLRRHGLSKADVHDGKVSVSSTDRFVLFDAEFVTGRSDEGEIALRWSAVASYRLSASG